MGSIKKAQPRRRTALQSESRVQSIRPKHGGDNRVPKVKSRVANKLADSQVDKSALRKQALVNGILQAIGENPEREGLLDTPKRVVKSWNDIFSGYKTDPEAVLSTRFDSDGYSQMVVLKDIELFSMCEHHMLPFVGKAHIAYIPGKKVVGLSKLARLVECFSRRLQIQERLTDQIAHAILDHLGASGVGVMIEAKHFCMSMRGVNKQHSVMRTSCLLGLIKESSSARMEFLKLIGP